MGIIASMFHPGQNFASASAAIAQAVNILLR
jgi:hypothetical protein